jgi:hypothetical protein
VDELLLYLVSLELSMNKAYNTARLIVLIHLVNMQVILPYVLTSNRPYKTYAARKPNRT